MNQSQLDKATALRKAGSLEKTIGYLQELLLISSDNALIYYHMAWAHDALGKEADAAPMYEKAIAIGLK